MLRGKHKNKLIYGGTLLAAFSLTIGSAWARELAELAPYVEQLGKSTDVQCPRNEYWMRVGIQEVQIPGKSEQACNSCKSELPNQASSVQSKYKSAVASDNAANASSAANSANAANTSNGQAVVSQGNHSNSGAGAQAGLKQKAANATGVATTAKQCAEKIKSTCQISQLGASAQGKAQQAQQACEQLASNAEQVAAEKAQSSGGMGDMSQLASALGQALGPLAQMMQGQPEAPMDPGITDSASTIAPPAGTSLGNSGNNLAGTSIGNGSTPNGAEFKAPKNNITGFGPAGSSNFGPLTGYDSLAGGGYGDSSSGGGTSVGAGYSSGGGSTGLDSSGSSMAPGSSDAEKSAAAAAADAVAESYEISAMGGGGGGKPFLGLKSRVDEDLAAGESVLGDLGLDEEGSRELASNDEPMGGIGEADGNTLFHVIHSKISEIKKRGSI